MTASSSPQAPPATLTLQAAEALAAELVAEMIQRWRQGQRLLPEDYLQRHPELWQYPEAAADLIYEELCLRQELGPLVPIEQVLARFPQWRPQLEVLFDCQRILGPRRSGPQFPTAGGALGDFLLLAELGRGAQGRVFLASQLSLGNRPVVLKLTPDDGREHLSLARLQHTHIVPLYSAQDYPERGLRALCMPYFGGATLDRLLDALRPEPMARRTGQQLLDALDRVQAAAPLVSPARGPARQALGRASYLQAVCWFGACLADALQYAHERGLVHLDLKPSNVLLAADGEPMLLDFHLAREPIHPEADAPTWLGGSAAYMSPEQQAALHAIERGRPVTRPVDRRSDVYSLGVLLFESLAGDLPKPGDKAQAMRRANAQVSVGLADVIARCLAEDPADRYAQMVNLAGDLRRHLSNLPLAGVRNRSLAERWRKWRRRKPHGIALAGMILAVLMAAGAVGLGVLNHLNQRNAEARTALNDGQVQMAKGQWDAAVATLRRGLAVARDLPFQAGLAGELDARLRIAQKSGLAADRAAATRELHELSDRIRFLYGANQLAPGDLQTVEGCCRTFWDNRERILERLSPAGTSVLEPAARDDLLDLAIFWADLQVRLVPAAEQGKARRQALTVLDQAESLFGPSCVLEAERRLHAAALPASGVAPLPPPRSAWEHYALARSLLRLGDLDRAAREVSQAVRLQPQGLWPNFYQGLCAYRQKRYEDAALAYSVCIGAAPDAAGCFYNRGLALTALGHTDQALRDYDQALRLDPTLGPAALNRGLLHYRAHHFDAAFADFQRARELGADSGVLALAYPWWTWSAGRR
jgi:serine/threonine protein kinase